MSRPQRTTPDDAAQSSDEPQDTPADVPTADETPLEAPSLADAFFTLCHALEPCLAEDLPALAHCQEIQVWMVNAMTDPSAAGKAQVALAWQHGIALLEQAVGVPLLTR